MTLIADRGHSQGHTGDHVRGDRDVTDAVSDGIIVVVHFDAGFKAAMNTLRSSTFNVTIFFMKRKALTIAVLFAGLFLLNWAFDYFVSDAAVRFAQQIRDGVRAHHEAPGQHYTLELHMRAFPQGCAKSYRVQFSPDSLIGVWCKNTQGQTTGSSTTTYHLNWVLVHKQFVLERTPEQPLIVELEAGADKHTIVDVR